MDRRAFLGGAITLLAADAPSGGRIYRVGILSLGPSGSPSSWWQSFIDELRQLNYVQDRNLLVRYLGADGRPDRLPPLAAELVKAQVDVLVTTGIRETLAAKRATSVIPVVFTLVADPIGEGVVTNLARPEGNVTGLTNLVPGFYGKDVELLRETVPSATRFAIVGAPWLAPDLRQEVDSAGRALGVNVVFVPVVGSNDFDDALDRAKRDGAAGIVVIQDVVTWAHRQELVQLALKYQLAGIYWDRSYVEAGGLMSYSADFAELRRRAAHYVDKILRGAKPTGLPIEQPKKFELVINLRAAKAIGLAIPPSLLARADEVIE